LLELNEPLPANGRYRVVLEDSRREIVSQNYFWVLPADARPVPAAGSHTP
jgi:hypothetical protein